MRTNNREKILDAALRLIEAKGLDALSYSTLAAESKMTNGGVRYHFNSRDELLRAVYTHLANKAEARIKAFVSAGSDASQGQEPHASWVKATACGATRGELQLLLDAVKYDHSCADAWWNVMDRWAIARPACADDASMARFILGLATQGLWIHDCIAHEPLPLGMRQRVADTIVGYLSASVSADEIQSHGSQADSTVVFND